jgi:predicted amidohydrolase YtcJ
MNKGVFMDSKAKARAYRKANKEKRIADFKTSQEAKEKRRADEAKVFLEASVDERVAIAVKTYLKIHEGPGEPTEERIAFVTGVFLEYLEKK